MIFLIALIIIGLGILFSAPFIESLAPSESILLVEMAKDEPTILAQGSATLWYQWQSWGYIGVAILIVCIFWRLLDDWIRTSTDKDIIKRKDKYEQLIKEQDLWRKEQIRDIRATLNKELERDRNNLQRYQTTLLEKENELDRKELESKEQLDKAYRIQRVAQRQESNSEERAKRQQLENRTKNSQRDRLREQKRAVCKYLEVHNSRITYKELAHAGKALLDQERS